MVLRNFDGTHLSSCFFQIRRRCSWTWCRTGWWGGRWWARPGPCRAAPGRRTGASSPWCGNAPGSHCVAGSPDAPTRTEPGSLSTSRRSLHCKHQQKDFVNHRRNNGQPAIPRIVSRWDLSQQTAWVLLPPLQRAHSFGSQMGSNNGRSFGSQNLGPNDARYSKLQNHVYAPQTQTSTERKHPITSLAFTLKYSWTCNFQRAVHFEVKHKVRQEQWRT